MEDLAILDRSVEMHQEPLQPSRVGSEVVPPASHLGCEGADLVAGRDGGGRVDSLRVFPEVRRYVADVGGIAAAGPCLCDLRADVERRRWVPSRGRPLEQGLDELGRSAGGEMVFAAIDS
jgi:hypothetical protein